MIVSIDAYVLQSPLAVVYSAERLRQARKIFYPSESLEHSWWKVSNQPKPASSAVFLYLPHHT